MKSKKTLLIIFAVLILCVLLFVAFLSVPFVKSNNLLIAANKGQMPYEQGQTIISEENYNKLFVLSEKISDDEYVSLKAKRKIKVKAFNKIDIVCDVTVKVLDFNTFETKTTSSKQLTMEFVFENFGWKVKKIK